MILQYATYRNIVIIWYCDLGIVIVSCRGASGNSHSYFKEKLTDSFSISLALSDSVTLASLTDDTIISEV